MKLPNNTRSNLSFISNNNKVSIINGNNNNNKLYSSISHINGKEIIKSNDIRKSYLDYFNKNENHSIYQSASLIPNVNDHSLLFTSAGMVPFKQYFLGNDIPKNKKITSCQKCLRVGGKHNDLDEVGFTNRHQTLFEMLGNFSFGDYFKEKAIFFAWDYLTNTLKIPKNKLCITVFKDDLESEIIWKKITGFKTVDDYPSLLSNNFSQLRSEHIVRMDHQDNFWSMGDEPDSPCGPCTEIYFDRGEEAKYKQERYLEIWNLVFMQYKNGKKKGELLPLPNPCVDTGMGLERLASVMQNVDSNFEIDSMQLLVNAAKDLSFGSKDEAALRVIADHSRAASFLVADGVVPSNIGRGYVLRRIIRRAAGFGHQIGITEPFLSKMLPVIESSFPNEIYPELRERRDIISSVISGEEEIFSRTLERGMKMLNKKIDEASNTNNKILKPLDAFQLYDTFGFPLDFVQRIIKIHGLTLDLSLVDKLMQEQRERSGNDLSNKKSLSLSTNTNDKDSQKDKKKHIINNSTKASITASVVIPDGDILHWAKDNIFPKFVGYDNLIVNDSSIIASSKVKDRNDEQWIAITPCPFYPQGGGQVGDIGTIEIINKSNSEIIKNEFQVLDCIRAYGDNAVLRVKGNDLNLLKPNTVIKAIVNSENRNQCSIHHTSTHLLHAALRERFGKTIGQAGSLVNCEQFRFDFTHPRALNQQDITFIESYMNSHAKNNLPVSISEMSLIDAKEIGAIMMFNEKYNPEKVRVVKIGENSDKNKFISIELCGGTHVNKTLSCYPIKILSETSVAAGTRRIEAVAGEAALNWYRNIDKTMAKVIKLLGLSESNASDSDFVMKKMETIKNQSKILMKEIEKLEKSIASSKFDPIAKLNNFKISDDLVIKSIYFHKLEIDQSLSDDIKRNCLRQRGEYLRKEYPEIVHIIQSGNDFMCMIETKHPQNKNINAGNVIKYIFSKFEGKGGGSNFMATFHLKEFESIETIISKIENKYA